MAMQQLQGSGQMKQRDRIEALEKALREIVKMCDVRIHRLSLFDEIQQHARAALAPEQDK